MNHNKNYFSCLHSYTEISADLQLFALPSGLRIGGINFASMSSPGSADLKMMGFSSKTFCGVCPSFN